MICVFFTQQEVYNSHSQLCHNRAILPHIQACTKLYILC